jgi:hypothetical protein
MGFIYEMKQELTKLVNYEEIQQEIGNPLEIFEGFYEPEKSDIVISILTGLTYPIARIEEIKSLVNNKKIKTEEKDYDEIFNNVDTDWFDEARSKRTLKTLQNDPEEDDEEYDEFEEDDADDDNISIKKSKPKKKKSSSFDIEDIFAKY